MRCKVASLFLLAASIALGSPGGQKQSKPEPHPADLLNKAAPPLQVTDWLNTKGTAFTLAKLKGKVVVVDFWAYW